MEPTERDGRWNGWYDPNYQPSDAELNAPVVIDCDDPDELASILLASPPANRVAQPHG